MIRSMYSAVSGLATNQVRMDIIGNNISNVNTLAYKTNVASVASAFEQTSRTANSTQPTGLTVGLGTQIVGTVRQFTQGAFQRTDVVSDLGIQGDGFFAVNLAETGVGVGYLTRAGNFVKDSEGYLRMPEGPYLLGDMNGINIVDATGLASGAYVPADANILTPVGSAGFPADRMRIPTTIAAGAGVPAAAADEPVVNFSIRRDGMVTAVGSNGTLLDIGYVTVQKYSNNNGLKAEGGNLYTYTSGAGTNQFFAGTYGGSGSIQSGTLEISNVDMSREFSDMIITQRGFDANARTISTSDEMLQTLTNMKR